MQRYNNLIGCQIKSKKTVGLVVFNVWQSPLLHYAHSALRPYGTYFAAKIPGCHKPDNAGRPPEVSGKMSRYLSALLQYDFKRYFRKNLFIGQDDVTVQMSLFGDMPVSLTEKGRRAYAGNMPQWIKEGAMMLFEGQVGTLQFRKSSFYEETAVDFVPMDEGKVNVERAGDYLPLRETYFELSTKEREEEKEQAALREKLNVQYDAFVAKWGFFHENDNKDFIMQDSLGIEVYTIEM